MRKILTSLALASTLFVAGAMTADAQSFKDVPETHTYATEIEEMKKLNVITGYEDRTFRPTTAISRKHVAALIYKAMPLEAVRPAVEFADVPKSSSYYPMIQALYRAGIVDGNVVNGKRYYNPDATLTRAHMAKMLALAFNLEDKGAAPFVDVNKNDWAYPYVNRLYASNITTGNNGRFNPSNHVNRQHFAVFMYRALGNNKKLSLDGQALYTVNTLLTSGKAFAPGYYSPGEVPVAEYVFIPPTDDLMYYGEELDNGYIIDNEIFITFGYVYVHGRGNIETDGILLPLSDVNKAGYTGAKALYAALLNKTNYTGEGMYKVGVDVSPGSYTFTSVEEDAYVSLETGPVGLGDIVTNEIFTGSYRLSGKNGQYIYISGAKM